MDTERSAGEWSQAVRLQAALAHLGQVGLQPGELAPVLDEALVVVADMMGVTDVALFERPVGSSELSGLVGLRDGRSVSGRAMLAAFGRPGPGTAPVEALETTEAVSAEGDGHGGPPSVAAAVGWGSHVHGILVVYGEAGRCWSDDERQFVRSASTIVGLAVQRATAERELRNSSARLDVSLSAGGLGTWAWDVDGDQVELDERARALFGLTADTFEGHSEQFLALVHPDDRHQVASDVLAAAEDRTDQHQLYRIIRRDNGEVRWVESWGRELADGRPGRRLVGVSADVTDRHRADQEREASLARERSARLDAEAARERLAFLAGATRALSTSLDPEETLACLAELCVPDLADACFIDLRDDDERLVERVGRATDPELLAHAGAARPGRLEMDELAEAPRPQLLVQGGRAGVPERHTILAPLVARGRVTGMLTLVRVGDDRPFVDEDVTFTAELAGRAALATDNARLYRSRNRVARSLQSALLPPALPEIEGLALAARYDVAEADVAIGGDFYDVMALGHRSWGVVIGDVCGRGPDAAALTGLVRQSVRTVVVSKQVPSEVLALTNEAVLRHTDDASFCTAAYLHVRLSASSDEVEVTASSAGHPRPVVVRAGGEVSPMDCAGTLLGVMDEPVLRDASVRLGPGDAVVLYTDGLTEARRGGEQFGEERLIEALRGAAGREAPAVAQALDDAVDDFRRSDRDDTAILVVQAVARPSLADDR